MEKLTIARIKLKGERFEIVVHLDKALEFKQGKPVDIKEILETDHIFKDHKKGLIHSTQDLINAFGTDSIEDIAARILKDGELVLPESYRAAEREARLKQLIDWLSKNAINPKTSLPYSPELIRSALEKAKIKIDLTQDFQTQVKQAIDRLTEIIPIKIEHKKFECQIPAIYTGKVYSCLLYTSPSPRD